MSFTLAFTVIALFVLAAVFGFTLKLRGIKAAWIAAGVTLAIEIIAFFGLIAAIISVMPN